MDSATHDMTGRVAVITGGARGMGAHTVRRFVEAGAQVVIADLLHAEGLALADELGDAARFHRHDVASESSWQALAEATLRRLGRIDVLVNNAGVMPVGTLEQMPLAQFERALSVNLVGPFLGIQAVTPAMRRQGRGAIVNISSVDGLRGANGLGAYVSSKWGVRGLTKVAALELGPHGIRVNSVHPGGVDTQMANPGGLPRDALAGHYRHVPLQRIGAPEEVARATLFLASDAASYCNGSELAVDGGAAAGFYYDALPGAATAPTSTLQA